MNMEQLVKTSTSATLSTTDTTLLDLESKFRCRGGNPTPNRLNHGKPTVFCYSKTTI
jgi:hypothetical protein